MTTEKEDRVYQKWCAERELDPELGDSARAYEEHLAGGPIEEWWDAMDDAAVEEQRYLDRDGGARL